jgi:hypothetical protein
VSQLSNAQLGTGATITLHACYSGYSRGGRLSIAQLIANQLQRTVLAPLGGTFFTINPNSTANDETAPKNLPNQIPIYLLQDSGKPFGTFLAPLNGH